MTLGPGSSSIKRMPGRAALLVEERGVPVAGEELSDILVPLLALNGAVDPIEDNLTALRLLEGGADDVDVLRHPRPRLARRSLIGYTHGSTRIGRACPSVTPSGTLMPSSISSSLRWPATAW
jgi:hypothetical protein